jgi:hypothetical protein
MEWLNVLKYVALAEGTELYKYPIPILAEDLVVYTTLNNYFIQLNKVYQIMSSYHGKCHCGNTEWTAKLDSEQQGHILWYVSIPTFSLTEICWIAILTSYGY